MPVSVNARPGKISLTSHCSTPDCRKTTGIYSFVQLCTFNKNCCVNVRCNETKVNHSHDNTHAIFSTFAEQSRRQALCGKCLRRRPGGCHCRTGEKPHRPG